MKDDKELWPFDSSSSSTNSSKNRTLPISNTRNVGNRPSSRRRKSTELGESKEKDSLLSGSSKNHKEPVTYSAFGVTISTFKDPDETSPAHITTTKKKKTHRRHSSSFRPRHYNDGAEEEMFPSDLFEGDESKMPLISGQRQRTNTENSSISYGSSRLSFPSRDSGSIRNLRADGTSSHEDSLDKSEFCASLFLPSLSFQSSFPRDRHLFGSSDSFLESLVERLYPDRTATAMHAISNLLPCLAGSAVFSMPFAIVAGGYLTLVFMVIMSLLADFTAKLLVDCLYEISPNSKQRKRVRKDLADIAREVWGRVGAFTVHFLLVVYLFLGNAANILLLAKSMYSLIYTTTKLSFVVLTCLFSLLAYPLLFVRKLTVLAYISLLSVTSIVIGIIALLVIFIKEYSSWPHNYGDIPFLNWQRFPLSMGIFMFSCVSHSLLPQIEGSMADPTKINKALHISYFSSAAVKMLLGLLGALAFGLKTESLITLNASRINEATRTVLGVTATMYAILNFPLNMFIICETVDKLIAGTSIERSNKLRYTWLVIVRFLLLAVTVTIALGIPYFGILIAIRGSLIGTCLIFVFPCYFHLKLKWSNLTLLQGMVDIVLLTVGIVLGVLSLYTSIDEFTKAIKTGVE